MSSLDLFTLSSEATQSKTMAYVCSKIVNPKIDYVPEFISSAFNILSLFHSQYNAPITVTETDTAIQRLDERVGYSFIGIEDGVDVDFSLCALSVAGELMIFISSYSGYNEQLIMVFKGDILVRLMTAKTAIRENLELYYTSSTTLYSCDGKVTIGLPRRPKYNFNITKIYNVLPNKEA